MYFAYVMHFKHGCYAIKVCSETEREAEARVRRSGGKDLEKFTPVGRANTDEGGMALYKVAGFLSYQPPLPAPPLSAGR